MPTPDMRPLGVLSIGVPYLDVETAHRHSQATRRLLESTYRLVGPPEVMTDLDRLDAARDEFRLAGIQSLLLQIATFPDGEAPARIAQRVDVQGVVHALPKPRLNRKVALNSLCGANMTTFTLTALEAPHLFRLAIRPSLLCSANSGPRYMRPWPSRS